MTIQEFIGSKNIKVNFSNRSTLHGEKNWPDGSHRFRVEITFGGKSMITSYTMGPGCKGEPKAAELIDCLASDAQAGEMDFDEFKDEFGYDTDEAAKKVYKACQRTRADLHSLLGEAYQELLECERL